MRITKTDIWKVVVPTIPGSVHSPQYGPAGWDMVPKYMIRVNTDEGIYGIGETGRGCPLDAVEANAKELEGQDPKQLCWQDLSQTHSPSKKSPDRSWERAAWQGGGPAYDAFEMAFFDILGKFLEVPAHVLLGGAVRDKVRADYWIGHQIPEDAARSAKKAVERGFKGLKMKCTVDEPMVERIQAILDAAGPEFKITVDPNERFYRPCEAIALAKELEKLGNVEVFEDPVPKWNIDWYREIRSATSIPIAMHLGNPRDIINAIKANAVDYMNLGGSMTGFVKNAAIADAAGIPIWHGSGNDLGITETSFVHAAAVCRNCILASDFVGGWTREDDLIVEPLTFKDGYTPVPQKPGLGCELDMDAVEKYRV